MSTTDTTTHPSNRAVAIIAARDLHHGRLTLWHWLPHQVQTRVRAAAQTRRSVRLSVAECRHVADKLNAARKTP